MLIADTDTASSVIFLDNVSKYFTEVRFRRKCGSRFYETPLVCRSTSLVTLDIHRTVVAGLDDGIRAALIDATQARVLYGGPRDTNRPASLL